MASGSPCVPRAIAVLALALLLPSCQSSPTAAGRAGRDDGPEARADPVPPAVVVAPPVDPLGIPPPPPGSRTSDRGDRLARPTPVGQLAPEDAPPPGR